MSAKKKKISDDRENSILGESDSVLPDWKIDIPVFEIDIPEWKLDLDEDWSELNIEWESPTIEDWSNIESDLDIPDPNPNLMERDVAAWMLSQVEKHNQLYQNNAARHIKRYFGERFVYKNKNANLAIQTEVLKEFLQISIKTVVWHRRERFWRIRQPDDASGRSIS